MPKIRQRIGKNLNSRLFHETCRAKGLLLSTCYSLSWKEVMAQTQSKSLNKTHEGTLIPDLFSLASSSTSFMQCRLNCKGIILAVQLAEQSLVKYQSRKFPHRHDHRPI